MFFKGCIMPHFFQFVKFTGFRQHNMNHNIYKIDQYPMGSLEPFRMIGLFTHSYLHMLLYEVRNCFNLGSTGGFADDKEISNSFGNFSQIQRNNMLSFFLLNGVDYGFENL